MILYTLLSGAGSRLASAVIGSIVIVTGVYFLLRSAFGLIVPAIAWDLVWPIVVIGSGVAIVSKAAESRPSRHAPAAPAEVETAPDQEQAGAECSTS
jgi:hypothetical protein